jgi:UDP-2,4-diacetamido-2,4,6-trideoxy-beta-L-altropyranose hydrolase
MAAASPGTEGAVFRCDGSATIGTGHIQRCLVLAAELAGRGWRVAFASRDLAGAPLDRIRRAGYSLSMLAPELDEAQDRALTLGFVRDNAAGWLVVDRYATRAEDLQELSGCQSAGRALRVLAVDDICEHAFPVDVLVNQNINAADFTYKTRADTLRLFGTRYALVGAAYTAARPGAAPARTSVQRILVFMGGGNTVAAVERVLQALRVMASDSAREIRVVVGAASHAQALAGAVANLARSQIVHGLANLVEPLGWADLFVTAGGSVAWEACCLGVPMLIVTVAENQELNAAKLHALGAAVHVGRIQNTSCIALGRELEALVANPAKLGELGQGAWQLVDGLGAQRVADAMEVG